MTPDRGDLAVDSAAPGPDVVDLTAGPSELVDRIDQFEHDILNELQRQIQRAEAAEAKLQVADQTRHDAQRWADAIVAEAGERARDLVASAERDADRIRSEAREQQERLTQELTGHLAGLADAYREAMDEARRTVRDMLELQEAAALRFATTATTAPGSPPARSDEANEGTP